MVSYLSVYTYVLGAQNDSLIENCLIKRVLLTGHNIMFWLRNTKINFLVRTLN